MTLASEYVFDEPDGEDHSNTETIVVVDENKTKITLEVGFEWVKSGITNPKVTEIYSRKIVSVEEHPEYTEKKKRIENGEYDEEY